MKSNTNHKNDMNKNQVLLAVVLGLTTVLIGAFGAHGLKSVLMMNEKLEVFKFFVFN